MARTITEIGLKEFLSLTQGYVLERQGLAITHRGVALSTGRRGWVLQSRTADSLGGVPSRSSWGWANRTHPGSLVGAQRAGQALRVYVEPHSRGSFPECADRPTGFRSAVG